jgi:hypothetical protein
MSHALKVLTTRVRTEPMEPRACIVSYDAASDSYDIYRRRKVW